MTLNRDDIIQAFRTRIAAGKRNKLSKQEFDILVDTLIERLQNAKSSEEIHDICRREIALLEEGYKKLTLASIYIPRYRAAIKDAIASKRLKLTRKTSHEYEYQQRVTGKREQRHEHWALTYFKYTPEEYEQLDTRQAEVNQKRLSSLKTVELDRYLDAIGQLLHSQDKFAARHQAIAIAALTGRRMGEVVAQGNFSLTDHPYQLHFTGQQKYERDGYDILTLIPAADVLSTIRQFRAQPEIQALLDLDRKEFKQQLNKFDVLINKECDKYLHSTQIVPPLEGKKSVTIHNLRSLWGAIACHFFCPEHQHEYAFLQHYLGHVLKSSATGHYFRYQLVDRNGNLIKTKGTKLTTLSSQTPATQEPELQPLPLETAPPAIALSRANTDFSEALATLNNTWQQRWEQVEERLTSVELSLSTLTPSNEVLKITELTEENQDLQAQNLKLAEQLRQAEHKLEQFRQLLLTDTELSTADPDDASTIPAETIQQPARPLQSASSTPPKKPGRKPGKAIERAKSIFHNIQTWNHRYPDNTFAINAGFLESVFHVNRKAAQQFCKTFKAEILKHHQAVGIIRSTTHNRGKNTQDIVQFVQNNTP